MDKILNYAISENASDIHVTQDKPCWVRIKGSFLRYDGKITIEDIDDFVEAVIPEAVEKYLRLRNRMGSTPVDGAFKYGGRRFRINIYLSKSGVNMALRLLSDKILPIARLSLPESVQLFTHAKEGMYLVVGTTGSGKSTTLASVIDEINRTRSENILTVEEPIEYVYCEDKCRIEQIEVGKHIESFEKATVAAMRQNPNILLIGEMRDLETIQNAITLAETGHAVFGTLHAKSVTDTIDRIVDVFPPKQQEQIRLQLSGVLKGVIHQTLAKSQTGGVVPVIEQLMVDDVVASMICAKQKPNTIRDYMRGKSLLGNVHRADNLYWHIQNGRMDIENAKRYLSPDEYAMLRAMCTPVKGGGFGG